MSRRLHFLLLCVVVGFVAVVQLAASPSAYAFIPAGNHTHKYIQPDGSFIIYVVTKEDYVKNTLPNEWLVSWNDDALKAGAIIIRSGAYWRINRTVLNSSFPNNNCYKGIAGSSVYYETVPNTRGGHEQWLPSSNQAKTDADINAVANFHMEVSPIPSGRPDALISLRYNSTIQQRTQNNKGTWSERYRFAYVGSGSPGAPFDPNQDCSQSDDQTNSNPAFANT